jgi:hypothetical protein
MAELCASLVDWGFVRNAPRLLPFRGEAVSHRGRQRARLKLRPIGHFTGGILVVKVDHFNPQNLREERSHQTDCCGLSWRTPHLHVIVPHPVQKDHVDRMFNRHQRGFLHIQAPGNRSQVLQAFLDVIVWSSKEAPT